MFLVVGTFKYIVIFNVRNVNISKMSTIIHHEVKSIVVHSKIYSWIH